MAQLSDDCFAFGGPLMTAHDALALLKERLHPVADTEQVSLADAAGRILAENIDAPGPVPPFDNAAVDGYAVRHDDLNAKAETVLPIAGRIAAGHPAARPAKPGEAWQIFTGAPMPEGPDTVVMQEDCRRDGDRITVPAGVKPGINRRRAGEDIGKGEVILRTGQRLRPQHIGQAASIAQTELRVFKRLRVGLFSTGDEIRDVGDTLDDGCIFDSNRYSVAALLSGLGCEVDDLGILPDRREDIEAALRAAATDHDVIISSAGVSAGEEDHVRLAVESLGNLYFWRLAIRPGRPLALGQIGSTPFIGLPGNPVAVMVTFMRFARPALLLLGGATETDPLSFRVPAQFSYRKKAGRREWIRVSLKTDEHGVAGAEKFPRDGAGILSSMVASDGLLELPEELTEIEPGTMLDFIPFSEVS